VPEAELCQDEAMVLRALRRISARAFASSVVLAVSAAGCGTSGGTAESTTTVAPAVLGSVPSTPASTTITAVPAGPRSSASSAAQYLINSWENNDRPAAMRVATPAAVTALFARPYAGQTVVSRDCSLQFPPPVCSFGPSGGGSGSLYQIFVTQVGSQWYVSSVAVEG